jgi:lysophospholipase L1-like esterase
VIPAALTALVIGLSVLLQAPSDAGPKTAALFFGDSLFAGTGTSPKRPVQVTDTAKRLGWRPTVDAFGGTGWTTGGKHGKPYLYRLQHDGRLDKHYDVVVLEGGTNDAFYGDPERIPEKVAEVITLVRQKQPHARIVLVGGYAAAGRDGARFVRTDGLLAAAAADLGLQYVSQYHYHLLDNGFLSHDHIHPTRAGYRLMAADLARALQPSAVPTRVQ